MRKFSAMLASGTLVLGALALTPAAAAAPPMALPSAASVAAATAKAPRIVSGKQVKTATKLPYKSVRNVKLPVLLNSTTVNRQKFAGHARALVNAELKAFDSFRRHSCRGSSKAAVFSVKPTGYSVYKGRYASVVMASTYARCAGASQQNIRSFTLDLRTGKKAVIGSFLAQDDLTTKIAVWRGFSKDKNRCVRAMVPSARTSEKGYVPRPKAWMVSAKGIRVHYAKYAIGRGSCGNPSVLLPWNQITSVRAIGKQVHHRTYVQDLGYDKKGRPNAGFVLSTSVQGRKVSLLDWGPGVAALCYVGVRDGKLAIYGDPGGMPGSDTVKLRDTGSNPRFDMHSYYGRGWSVATAKELKALRAYNRGPLPKASTTCR